MNVPEGWKMVPLEATPEMLEAGCTAIAGELPVGQKARRAYSYRRMLAAAPQPPAPDEASERALFEKEFGVRPACDNFAERMLALGWDVRFDGWQAGRKALREGS